MTVLVLNAGSSSLKWEHFEADPLTRIDSGNYERIGDAGGDAEDHAGAVDGVLDDCSEAVSLVVHRVVHGGESFVEPTVIDDAVVGELEALSALAPLHNPPALAGIAAARSALPDVPHVAVFDTAFHATLPPAAYRYAVPDDWYVEHGVRRYGFHGTSHAYVARQAADAIGRPLEELRLISLHLGNGASACAIDGGSSVETSMGLTPLEGLVMGTRSGDIDPAAAFHMIRRGVAPGEVETALNRRSGLTGLSGAGDMRDVQQRAADGDASAQLALDVMAHRLRKYVGAYLAVLGGLDGLVFTAGIGQHSPAVRSMVIEPLEHLGLRLDRQANDTADAGAGPVRISPGGAQRSVWVVATDEELEMARQALALLQ